MRGLAASLVSGRCQLYTSQRSGIWGPVGIQCRGTRTRGPL